MLRAILAGVLFAGLAGGCTTRATVAHSAAVTVATPDLVAVGPGIYVIADYGEPIFFADGFYWWFYGGLWYRSTYYTGGWVYVPSPPVVIARISQPHVYRHYRPAGFVHRSRPVPVQRVRPPVVRDHRRG